MPDTEFPTAEALEAFRVLELHDSMVKAQEEEAPAATEERIASETAWLNAEEKQAQDDAWDKGIAYNKERIAAHEREKCIAENGPHICDHKAQDDAAREECIRMNGPHTCNHRDRFGDPHETVEYPFEDDSDLFHYQELLRIFPRRTQRPEIIQRSIDALHRELYPDLFRYQTLLRLFPSRPERPPTIQRTIDALHHELFLPPPNDAEAKRLKRNARARELAAIKKEASRLEKEASAKAVFATMSSNGSLPLTPILLSSQCSVTGQVVFPKIDICYLFMLVNQCWTFHQKVVN